MNMALIRTQQNPGQAGFSAVEMLLVLGVFAILAMMAVPSYQSKIIRDQVAAAIPLADTAKDPISAYRRLTGELPADNKESGLPVADKIVSNHIQALEVVDGAIHLVFGNSANNLLKGKILTIRPAIVEDEPVVPIAWICGNAGTPDKMVVQGENRTDIPDTYLPVACRKISSGK